MQVLEYSITVFKYGVICIFLISAFDLHKPVRIRTTDTAGAIAAFLHSVGFLPSDYFGIYNSSEREMVTDRCWT